MSENTSTKDAKTIDLAVTMRGDVNAANLADYVSAVVQEQGREAKTRYGTAVVFLAAVENEKVDEFVKATGFTKGYVSQMRAFARAVEVGLSPHASSEKMRDRWAALMRLGVRSQIRKALNADPFRVADFDAAVREIESGKASKTAETSEGETNTGHDPETSKAESRGEIVTRALDQIDSGLATFAEMLKRDKIVPSERERLDKMLTKIGNTLKRHDAEASKTTSKAA
jgi:hypothetical protein